MVRAVSRLDEGKAVCCIREDFALYADGMWSRYFIVCVCGRDEPYAKVIFIGN